MKLTLATCALGALGLTPALYGSHGDPAKPPVPPAAPEPVALRAVAPSAALVLPLAPAASARLLKAGLQEGSMDDDLQRHAEGLQDEIERLRKELKAMQKDMRKKKQAAKKAQKKRKAKEKTRGEAKAPEAAPEVRVRLLERMEGRREELEERREERREELEERREELRNEREERRKELEERRGELEERAEEMRIRFQERGETERVEAIERAMEQAARSVEMAQRAEEQARGSAAKAKGFFFSGSEETKDLPKKSIVKSGVWVGTSKDGEPLKWIAGNKNAKDAAEGFFQKTVVGSKPHAIGSNTFHIHVEDGDVHIHASGDPSITTSQSRPGVSSLFTGRPSGALDPSELKADKAEAKRFLAKIVTGQDASPRFAVKVNGEEFDFENLDVDLGTLALQGVLSQVEGLEGVEIHGLEGLEGLGDMQGNLQGFLEGLEGLSAIDMTADFDFDFDFDFDEEECVEEITEEPVIEESAIVEEERDERFVSIRPGPTPTQTFRFSTTVPGPQEGFPPSPNRLSGGIAAVAPLATATTEAELLQLAREIQADVAAMRAELNELRDEVRSAPRRR